MKPDVAAMRAELHKRFPLAFADFNEDKRPLTISIHMDILAVWPEVDRQTLNHALSDYTGGARYLRACVLGAKRIGINGEICGKIGAREARHANRLYKAEMNRRQLVAELREARATIADLQRQLNAA